MMVKVSKRLIVALKLSDQPAYRIAQRAKIDPPVLSKLIHGALPVQENDPRILRVAKLLGVPAAEAFESGPSRGRSSRRGSPVSPEAAA